MKKPASIGFEFRTTGKWFLLSAAVGVVAGCGAIAFQVTEQTVFHFVTQQFAGFAPGEAAGEARLFGESETAFSPMNLLIVLAVGALASGALVQRFAPEAEGHGTDAAIESFHHKQGVIRPIVPLIKLLASSITIGTAGSGGREGPIAQIGAGFGSNLATWLKLPVRDRRILLAAGMGAGVAAIFRAPLAGAIFAAEIFYRDSDLETDVIVPSAVSSVVSYSVFSFWLPTRIRFMPLFGDELQHQIGSAFELLPMTLLAVGLVGVGVVYIKTFYGLHHVFKSAPIPRMVKPIVGALAAGLIGLALYYMWNRNPHALAVLGTGYGALQQALSAPHSLGWQLLMTIALLKIVTTALTIGSGGSGGVFGPSMVIGGCTGAAIGDVLHRISPALVPHPGVYAVLGMAGFFAGCAHAPISTILMVAELTGDYSLLIPAMWVSTLCVILGRPWTLYEKQVPSRLDSPAHRGDFLIDVLEGIKVRDIQYKERAPVYEGAKLSDIIRSLAKTRQHYFPVVDSAGKFVGIFSTNDVRQYLFDETLWDLVNARDLMTTRIISVTPQDDLNIALKRFTELNLDEIPVVASDDPQQLLGMLRRKDVIAHYNKTLISHKQATLDEQ